MTTALERYLTEDHVRLDGLLRASLRDERHFDTVAFEEFRAGLLRHIGIEEKLLLPLARRALPGSLVSALRVEHAALASLLVPTPDHALAREIASLLETHNGREEGTAGLYAQCAAFDSEDLVERMRATRPPPLAKHFDGTGVHRTAEAALQSAGRSFARRAG
jgi:hypothetical protein